MKLLYHTLALKNILSHGTPSDDFSFSNRLIAHFLKVARAKLIEQKADKYHFISDQSYQSLCVDLVPSSYHNCCDTDVDTCQILKSIDIIPKFLNSRWDNFLKAMDLTGNVIPEFNLTQNKFSKYALYKPTTGWFLHDNHLYIINNVVLEKVLLNALFDDPSVVSLINCSSTTGNCNDPFDEEFPIDSDLVDPMYKMAMSFLLQGMQLPKDLENDTKDSSQVATAHR